MPKTRTKTYASPYRSMAAIWNVLADHSSPEKPMSIPEIVEKLKEREEENAPSATTLKRLLPAELETLDTLFPGLEVRLEGAGLQDAYLSKGKLHAVVEDRSGEALASGKLLVVVEPREGTAPAYSTVDNLLKTMAEYSEQGTERNSLPLRLKCVVARSRNGKTVYLPYSEEQDKWEEKDASSPGKKDPNNRARRYYLESVLTPAQSRMLADMIKVYPYIGESETGRMLSALSRVFPGCDRSGGSRYPFKKKNDRLFKNLELLDQAIRTRHKVMITYGEYVLKPDGKPVLQKRESAGQLEFEPYALMWSNGYYYLVGKNRGMMNLRADRILKVLPMDRAEDRFEIPGDFDPVVYRDKSPIMYPGMPQHIVLRCQLSLVNVVMDFFGEQASFRPPEDGFTQVRLNVAPAGAMLFAMQYADRVEVLEPASLREQMAQNLRTALSKYEVAEA